jgi:photosystem II stability/assembly factor-like uncharacterized protein
VNEPVLAIARTGERLVAVGLRGLVIVSDDDGKQWRQIPVEVGSDLLSVQFVNDKQGWIAGNDGVILHTVDRGDTWVRQLDGRQMATLFQSHFQEGIDRGDVAAADYLDEIKLNFQYGPEQPILGVWFQDPQHGFAVSTFGMLLSSEDGGKTWQSWMERVDNPQRVHFYSVTGIDGDVYLTGEQGMVFRLDQVNKRFLPLSTGYTGGLFGIVGNSQSLIAYGLQGKAFASSDKGQNWQRVETPLTSGINAGVRLDANRFALVARDGRVVVGSLKSGFEVIKVQRPMLFTGVSQMDSKLILTGLNGVQRADLK